MTKLVWSNTDKNNPYFPYTHEMNVYIESKIKKGISHYFIHKTWPEKWKRINEDTGKEEPTGSSIRRRCEKVEQYGADKLRDTKDDDWSGNDDWTTEMDNLLKKTYREYDGSVDKTKRFLVTILEGRSFSQIESRIGMLHAFGELEFFMEGKRTNSMRVGTDGWIARLENEGWQIDKDFTDYIASNTLVPVLCPAGLHSYGKVAKHYMHGCHICHSFNKHWDPLAPGILYGVELLDSTEKDFKPGKTLVSRGIEIRTKDYGKIKVLFAHYHPIGEVEDFEGRMNEKYKLFRTYNSMLKGDGSTECLHLSILPDYEKDIENEWPK